MVKIEPRSYQKEARDSFKIGEKNLMVLGVRFGKSLVSQMIVDKYFENKKVLIVVGRLNIINQFPEYFENRYTWIVSGRDYDQSQQVHLATYQTLMRRDIDLSQYSLLVADEHHERRGTDIVKKLIETIPSSLLLTGTPLTNSNKLFNKDEFNWIQPITVKEVLEKRWLAPTTFIRRLDVISTNTIKSRSGEYTESEVRRVIAKEDLLNHIANYIKSTQLDKTNKTFIYLNFIEDVDKLYELLKGRLNIFKFHSKVTSKSNEEALAKFKEVKSGVMISVRSLSLGTNIPSADRIILGILTKIHSLFLQIVWRASTIDPNNPNKIAKVIDFTGQLGLVNPMTDFSEYTKNKDCFNFKCATIEDPFLKEICMDDCSESKPVLVYCGKPVSRIFEDPFAHSFKQVNDVESCGEGSPTYQWKFKSTQDESSFNITKSQVCPICEAKFEYKIRTLKEDPSEFIVEEHGGEESEEVIVIYNKEYQKAFVMMTQSFDTAFISKGRDLINLISKRKHRRLVSIHSNIDFSKVPNIQIKPQLSNFSNLIPWKLDKPTGVIKKFLKLFLHSLLTKAEYDKVDGMMYWNMKEVVSIPQQKELLRLLWENRQNYDRKFWYDVKYNTIDRFKQDNLDKLNQSR